jgi:hypothetical protein
MLTMPDCNILVTCCNINGGCITFQINHINDLFIRNNRMFISMFSHTVPWRETDQNSGVILESSLLEGKLLKTEPIFLIFLLNVVFMHLIIPKR